MRLARTAAPLPRSGRSRRVSATSCVDVTSGRHVRTKRESNGGTGETRHGAAAQRRVYARLAQLRRQGSNLRFTGNNRVSFQLDHAGTVPTAGERQSLAEPPALRPSPSLREIDAAAEASRRGDPVYGSSGRTPERCCLSHSPTLRPWIAGPWLRGRGFGVLRGGVLEPGSPSCPREIAARNSGGILSRTVHAMRGEPFSLRWGLGSF